MKPFFQIVSFLFVLSSTLYGVKYDIHDLGLRAYPFSYATHINSQGQVTGVVFDEMKYYFKWDPKGGFELTQASDQSLKVFLGCGPYINDEGVLSVQPINNQGDTFSIEDQKLYKKKKGEKTLLDDTLRWAPPLSVDFFSIQNNLKGQLLWGTVTPLRVNEQGWILGNTDQGPYLFIMETQEKIPLKSSRYLDSNVKIYAATDLNDNGTVTLWGLEDHWILSWFKSLLWNPSTGFKTYEGNFVPCMINNAGTVIGFYDTPGACSSKTEWNIPIELTDPWISVEGLTDINDNGQIVGWGQTKDHRFHAILLVPRQE